MKQVKKNTAAVCDYGYDPEGLRVWEKAGGKTTHYIFEGTEPIFEKQKDVGTGATIAIRSYVYVLGKHLARVDGVIGGGEAVYYYHTDHLGSTKVITDSSGNEIWRADYMAFGRQFGQSGTLEDTHGITGKEYDRETGLYYYNARWYDPELGRFVSEDPIRDPNNPNIYAYCSNNPLINIDPTGLMNEAGGTNGKYSYEDAVEDMSEEEKEEARQQIKEYWNDQQNFTDYWWQDPYAEMLALNYLLLEMLIDGPDSFIRSGANNNPNKIVAIQVALNVPITGEFDYQTLCAVENLQTLVNMSKSSGNTIGTRTIKALIAREAQEQEFMRRHPTYRKFSNLIEQGNFGYMFYAGVVYGSVAYAQYVRVTPSGGTQTVYRAMSRAEYEQLMSTGKFQEAQGSADYGKWFAVNYEDAVKWGNAFYQNQDHIVVKVKIPSDIAPNLSYTKLDRIGSAVNYDIDILNQYGKVVQ